MKDPASGRVASARRLLGLRGEALADAFAAPTSSKCACGRALAKWEALNGRCEPCRLRDVAEMECKRQGGPRVSDLFACDLERNVARRIVGAVAQEVEAQAVATIPTKYRFFSRIAWRGPWPFSAALDSWPNGDGAPWSVLIMGPPGVGKTMAETLLFREAVARWSHGGTWLDASALLDAMKSAFGSGRKSAEELACYSPGVLVLDDLGAERGTEYARSALSEILRRRHREYLPTIVSSNVRTAGELETVLDARVVSRFSEGELVLLGGMDRRAA